MLQKIIKERKEALSNQKIVLSIFFGLDPMITCKIKNPLFIISVNKNICTLYDNCCSCIYIIFRYSWSACIQNKCKNINDI